jgi:predicted metal-binding protein
MRDPSNHQANTNVNDINTSFCGDEKMKMRSIKPQTLSFASILFTAVFCCVASEKNLEDAKSSEVSHKSDAAVGIEVKRVKDAKTVEALRNAYAGWQKKTIPTQ